MRPRPSDAFKYVLAKDGYLYIWVSFSLMFETLILNLFTRQIVAYLTVWKFMPSKDSNIN